MAGQRQPIELLKAKGKKHLTKAEIAERENNEIKPVCDNLSPPECLTTKKQRERFRLIVEQLKELKIVNITDTDAIARYVIAYEMYVKLSKQIQKSEVIKDPYVLDAYYKNQDRAFKQCRQCAVDLGMTISSRCKLVVPKTAEKAKENKFAKYEVG